LAAGGWAWATNAGFTEIGRVTFNIAALAAEAWDGAWGAGAAPGAAAGLGATALTLPTPPMTGRGGRVMRIVSLRKSLVGLVTWMVSFFNWDKLVPGGAFGAAGFGGGTKLGGF
jgi:hypothetical protein